jgi:hypothetical protein
MMSERKLRERKHLFHKHLFKNICVGASPSVETERCTHTFYSPPATTPGERWNHAQQEQLLVQLIAIFNPALMRERPLGLR